jgi:hypothetical protein
MASASTQAETCEPTEPDRAFGITPKGFSFCGKTVALLIIIAAVLLEIFSPLVFDMDDILKAALYIACLGLPVDISIIISNLAPVIKAFGGK